MIPIDSDPIGRCAIEHMGWVIELGSQVRYAQLVPRTASLNQIAIHLN